MEKPTNTIVKSKFIPNNPYKPNNKNKIYKTKPTTKQKKVMEIITENQGIPIGKAMEQAGYTKVTAESPTNLTNSKSWQQLMDEYLPDQLLQRKHQEGLDATKKEDKEQVPDYAVRKQYLDLAYKIKGKNIDTPTQNINLNVVSDEQIKRLLD